MKVSAKPWELYYKSSYWIIREINGAEIGMIKFKEDAAHVRDLHNASLPKPKKPKSPKSFRYEFKETETSNIT